MGYYAKTPVNRQRQECRPTIAEESDSDYSSSDSSSHPDYSSSDSSSDSIQSDVEEDDVADAIRRMRPRLVPLARENHPSRASYYSQRTTTASPKRSGRRRRGTVTVVTVEDASGSECENEFDSPFKNRRPSPGQWMEPVESYLA